MKTLILGGVRSGKSRLAEALALKSNLPVTYIATATAGDAEMRARIEAHRARRAANWTVVEEPRALAASLRQHAADGRCVIVDCLTLWLTNLLMTDAGVGWAEARSPTNPNRMNHPGWGSPGSPQPTTTTFAHETKAFLAALPGLPGTLILVGNETGLGVMPLGELTRRFVDEAGHLHQALAQTCDRVVLTMAGLPIYLKGESP
ncbi:MAG: bifunctional adenosylcobinamide kinase/adenosylcobinamide-phosphate guanylyltransferase [Gammaproteobacteria bacterium]|nr:bifunctional adenosylcobinamide kinase/adenosylcobinamide-phosphate guanylyltransferase [Gammaproteobacteria bacterium]